MKELEGIKYIERKPAIKGDNNSLIVLIHGYGSNEEDLFSFEENLPKETHIVSVRGVNQTPYGGYSWYDINFVDNKKWTDEAQAIESKNMLVNFLDKLIHQEKLNSENVTLIGFSQGAILSYSIALNYPEKIKNVAILSGYPEHSIIGDAYKNKDFSHLNFFISHGTEDVVLPIDLGRMGEELVKSLAIKFEYHEYKSGHGIIPQNYFDLMNWLKKAK